MSDVVTYTLVANVGAIPANPANGDRVEVVNSTGIESFTPLTGLPTGFVGDTLKSARISYAGGSSTWEWISYVVTDPDARYAILSAENTFTEVQTAPGFVGSLTGLVTGDVVGNTTGVHTGDVIGDVTGDTSGTHTGPVIGDVTGDITGTADVAAEILRQDADSTGFTSDYEVLLAMSSSLAPQTEVLSDAGLHFNSGNNNLTAEGGFTGDLTGNADTATNASQVGGLEATQFLRSDVGDTADGAITFTDTNIFNKAGTGARFQDNTVLALGSGTDAELFCNGSHLYLDLNSKIGNFYIRDGTTTRYTFNDNGSLTCTGSVTATKFDGPATQADTAKRNTWSGSSTWRDVVAWTGTTATYNGLGNATSGYVQISGNGKMRVSGALSAASFNGTLGNGDVRDAMKGSSSFQTGTYLLATTNASASYGHGATLAGSALRPCTVGGNSQSTSPSGTWRSMGVSFGTSSNWTSQQGTLWLRIS